MRNFLIILFLFCSVTHSFSQKKKEIDVYLIGGQSNATGQGYMKNIPVEFEIDTSVKFFYSQYLGGGATALEWGPLCQASETSDKFGVELSMGTTLKNLNPDSEIAIIKHALSGSNLYQQWAPGKNKSDTASFGLEFKKFISTVELGLEKLKEQGYDPKIKAMVWQQGEADARDIAGAERARNYGPNLRLFIKRIRKQLNAPKMLFLHGYVIPVPLERFTGRKEVRAGQRALDQNSGDNLALKRVFAVETDDLQLRSDEPNSPYPDDQVHFGTFGILELGKRFAYKIHENLK